MIRPLSSQCAQCTTFSALNLRSVWGPEWGVPISSGADSLWVAQNGGGYQKGKALTLSFWCLWREGVVDLSPT